MTEAELEAGQEEFDVEQLLGELKDLKEEIVDRSGNLNLKDFAKNLVENNIFGKLA